MLIQSKKTHDGSATTKEQQPLSSLMGNLTYLYVWDISEAVSNRYDQERISVQLAEAHDVTLQRFRDQNIEDVCLVYAIPLKCAVLQVDPGAAWLKDNKRVAQASKVTTPDKEMRVRDNWSFQVLKYHQCLYDRKSTCTSDHQSL